MNQEKPFYKSKKFWYAVTIGFAATAKEMGIDIPPEALYAGLALILGQGLADLGKNSPKSPPPALEKAPIPQEPPQTITFPERPPEIAPGEKPISVPVPAETASVKSKVRELMAKAQYDGTRREVNTCQIVGNKFNWETIKLIETIAPELIDQPTYQVKETVDQALGDYSGLGRADFPRLAVFGLALNAEKARREYESGPSDYRLAALASAEHAVAMKMDEAERPAIWYCPEMGRTIRTSVLERGLYALGKITPDQLAGAETYIR